MTSAEIFAAANIVIFVMNIAISVWVMREARSTIDHATDCLLAIVRISEIARPTHPKASAA